MAGEKGEDRREEGEDRMKGKREGGGKGDDRSGGRRGQEGGGWRRCTYGCANLCPIFGP